MPKKPHSSSRSTLIKIAKIHILISIFFALQIILYDAGKLIPPEVVFRRWTAVSALALAAVIVWYLARLNNSQTVIRNLAWFIITVDLAVASYMVYSQRGMASRAVLLFVIPILTAAALHRKGMIYVVSALSVAIYTVTAIAYFVFNFNEGYKLELYGEIGFYSIMLLAIGWISWALVREKR